MPAHDRRGPVFFHCPLYRGFCKRSPPLSLRGIPAARDYAQSIVDTVREPLVVLDGDLTVISASQSFYRHFGVAKERTVGRRLYELNNRRWDIPRLRGLLETVLSRDTSFEDVAVEDEFPVIGHRKMLLNARPIAGKAGQTRLILLAMQDATGGPPTE